MAFTYSHRIVVEWGVTELTTLRAYVYQGDGTFTEALGPFTLTEFAPGSVASGIYHYFATTFTTSHVAPVVLVTDTNTGEWRLGEIVQLVNVVRANGRELEPRSSIPGTALVIVAPVNVNDNDRLNLVQGDDHASGDRVPTWTIEDYAGPSLSGSTGALRLIAIDRYNKPGANESAVLSVSASISQVSTTVTVTAAITAAQSALLASYPPGDETTHQYQLVATTSGAAVVTLKLGPVTVRRRINT